MLILVQIEVYISCPFCDSLVRQCHESCLISFIFIVYIFVFNIIAIFAAFINRGPVVSATTKGINNTAHHLQQHRAWATLRLNQSLTLQSLSFHKWSRKRDSVSPLGHGLRDDTINRGIRHLDSVSLALWSITSRKPPKPITEKQKSQFRARNPASITFSSNNSINYRPDSPITCTHHIQPRTRIIGTSNPPIHHNLLRKMGTRAFKSMCVWQTWVTHCHEQVE